MSISYEAHDWKKGDIITANDLKRFENGITSLINESETLGNTIKDLDVTDVENPAQFVSAVSQEDGRIEVKHATFSPSISIIAATSEQGENNSDKPRITFSVGGNPATSGDINTATTGVYGVTKLSSVIDSDSEILAATPKAVKDALESLDITQITNTAGKTIATIDEADGKVSATFQDIVITSDKISDRGAANCVATLDANGRVPASQLPSYVDDILEGTAGALTEGKIISFKDLNNNNYEPEEGKIYIDVNNNMSYRWAGNNTGYVKVASDLALGETSATAYRGDYGAAAYAHAVTNKGAAFAEGLYKITTNTEGHITNATAVTKADLLDLGVADASEPVLDGALSLGRAEDSEVGENSAAVGTNVTATGNSAFAQGVNTEAQGDVSHTEGYATIATGNCQHAAGKYNVIDNIESWPDWENNKSYSKGDKVKYAITDAMTGERTVTGYICNQAHTSSQSSHPTRETGSDAFKFWIEWDYMNYAEIIGNGTSTIDVLNQETIARSNARALDWDGNEYLNGNLYVNCNSDSTGGIMIGGTSNSEVEFSDGTTSVTFTMAQLVALKNLLST